MEGVGTFFILQILFLTKNKIKINKIKEKKSCGQESELLEPELLTALRSGAALAGVIRRPTSGYRRLAARPLGLPVLKISGIPGRGCLHGSQARRLSDISGGGLAAFLVKKRGDCLGIYDWGLHALIKPCRAQDI